MSMSIKDNTSHLIRTNPLLSGNIKLVVSGDKLYMDNYLSTGLMANDRFKGIMLPDNNYDTYAKAVGRYLYGVPSGEIYRTQELKDSVGNKFTDQYNTIYEAGVKIEKSGYYKDPFTIDAPLWIDSKIPEYFVVFGMDGMYNRGDSTPIQSGTLLSTGYYTSTSGFRLNGITYNPGDTAKLSESTHDWAVFNGGILYRLGDIKSYLDYKTIISKSRAVYICRIPDHTIGRYLSRHINDDKYDHAPVNIDFNTRKIIYHGIDVDTGVMVYKEEYLSDIGDKPISDFDMYINRGFERNRMISSNMINISFNFDDDVNGELTYNRYFGMYMTYKQLCRCGINPQNSSGRSLYPSVIPINGGPTITDEGGIRIGISNTNNSEGVFLTSYDDLSMYCIKKNDKYPAFLNNENSGESYVTLKDKSINLRNVFNIDSILTKRCKRVTTPGKSTMLLKLEPYEFTYGDKIKMLYGNSTYEIVADYLPNVSGFTAGDSLYHYFNPSSSGLIDAIIGAMNYVLPDEILVGRFDDSTISIQCVYPGNRDNLLKLSEYPLGSITILQEFIGGNLDVKSRVLIPMLDMNGINIGDYIDVGDYYAPITAISNYTDEPVVDAAGNVVGYDNIESYMVLNVSDDYDIEISNGTILVANDPLVSIGLMDIVDIKEMVLNTSIDRYGFLDNEYNKYYNCDGIITNNQAYRVYSDKPIKYNGITYSDGDIFYGVSGESSVEGDGSQIIINISYENDDEVLGFPGFYKPSRDTATNDIRNIYKFVSNGYIEDRLLMEDINPDLSLYGFAGYNNQWGMVDGLDATNQPYRLNISRALGSFNNSPSIFTDIADPNLRTHEWYYLMGTPEYPNLVNINDDNAYLARSGFDEQDYIRPDLDYFTRYFTISNFNYVDRLTGEAVYNKTHTKTAYSVVKKLVGVDGVYYTFFRGVLIKFNSDADLSNYKFTMVLDIKSDRQLIRTKPISIDQYVNNDHKNILIKINVLIDDYKISINGNKYFEYSYLYMMNSLKSIIIDGDSRTYKYGKRYVYPDRFANLQIINDDGSYNIAPNEFYGTQLYNKSVYGQVNEVEHIRFSSYIPVSELIRSYDDGLAPRLIAMDQNRFLAIAQIGGRIDSNNYFINGQPSMVSQPDENTIGFVNNGLFVAQIPTGKLGLNYNPAYVVNTIYPGMVNAFWFAENGGQNYYKYISELLSASSISSNLSDNADGLMSYYVIDNGELSSNNPININILKPTRIDIDNILNPTLTYNSQSKYSIGYETINRPVSIFRYGGTYMPLMKSVVKMSGKDFVVGISNINSPWNSANFPWTAAESTSNGYEFWSKKTPNLWYSSKGIWVRRKAPSIVNNLSGQDIPLINDFLSSRLSFIDTPSIIDNYFIRKISTNNTYPVSEPNTDLRYPLTGLYSLMKLSRNLMSDPYNSISYYNSVGESDIPYTGLDILNLLNNGITGFVSGHLNLIDRLICDITEQYTTISELSDGKYSIDIDIKKFVADYVTPLLSEYLANELYHKTISQDNIESIVGNSIIPNVKISSINVYSHITDDNSDTVVSIVNGDNISLLNAGYTESRSISILKESIGTVNIIKGTVNVNPNKLLRLNIKVTITNSLKNI